MIWAFLTTSAFGRTIAKIGAVVLAVLTFGAWQRRQGAQAQKAKQAADRAEAVQRGAEGAAQATKQLSKGKTPQEVKNGNDAAW